MLTWKSDVLRPQVIRNVQRNSNGILRVQGRTSSNSQRVKLEHAGLQTLEVIKRLEAGCTAIMGFAGRRPKLADTLGGTACATRAGDRRRAAWSR